MKNFPCIIFFKTVLLVFFTLLTTGKVFSFQATSFVPLDNSRLWIEGKSNVNEFECNAEENTGEATLPELNNPVSFSNRSAELLSIRIEIKVDSIECGKKKMNNDLRKALKADLFPKITFQFEEANLLSEPKTLNEAFEVEVHGFLTVAGNTRKIIFLTDAYYLNEQRVRAVGHTTIRMTDFGIEPPLALMGLIKADEELTVNFDLIATPKNNS